LRALDTRPLAREAVVYLHAVWRRSRRLGIVLLSAVKIPQLRHARDRRTANPAAAPPAW
jgi:hypothetical protein